MKPGDRPLVANASKYRLFREFTATELENRFMYPEDWKGWSGEELAAIAAFKKTFRPEWNPPETEFSGWHYLVLSRATNPAAYSYGKPVVVLMNEICFSATDIFLSALKGWHDVTLVGTPSSGGSSRIVSFPLKNSKLTVGLGSMVSFQRNGKLYDGNAVRPDIIAVPHERFFLDWNQDRVLDKAIELITPAAPPNRAGIGSI